MMIFCCLCRNSSSCILFICVSRAFTRSPLLRAERNLGGARAGCHPCAHAGTIALELLSGQRNFRVLAAPLVYAPISCSELDTAQSYSLFSVQQGCTQFSSLSLNFVNNLKFKKRDSRNWAFSRYWLLSLDRTSDRKYRGGLVSNPFWISKKKISFVNIMIFLCWAVSFSFNKLFNS